MFNQVDPYQVALRPLLFSGLKADPEWLHHRVMELLSWLNQTRDRPAGQWMLAQLYRTFNLEAAPLKQNLWNLTFPNPVGLAAGFDKDGTAWNIWDCFGFGFTELGTVTCHPQPGNPRPRLFRLLPDRAVLNRMGFNNQGSAALAHRLPARETCRQFPKDPGLLPQVSPIPLGINLGKSRITPLEAAPEDYRESFRVLGDRGDYFVVNVSSPNTPGLRSLQATEQLEPILEALQRENPFGKPLLVKIAPDLEWEDIAAVVTLAQHYHLAGIIATNTTIRREGLQTKILPTTGKSIDEEAGGISGAPLKQRSTEVIRFIWQQTGGTLPIIGVGGIFTAEDAWEKIVAGASLIQVYTGWIYEGPWMVRRILAGLLEKLEAHGLTSLPEAIGLENRKPACYSHTGEADSPGTLSGIA